MIRKSLVLPFFLWWVSAHGQFKEGYYFTKAGEKVSRLIKFRYGGNLFTNKSDGDCDIQFKKAKGADKAKFTTNDICCFVIGKDSFAIVKNFFINSLAQYPQDFAQVIETGRINLYKYYAKMQGAGINSGSYTVEYWLLEKDNEVEGIPQLYFKKTMRKYLSDYPSLVDQINNGKLKWSDIPLIINMYNSHFASPVN
jgi:hypothetical protein